MAEVEWTPDAAIRLMEEYKVRPELWDTSHQMYRIQTAKYEAWSDLARMFQCDIADLRKKMNSIFASYRREKAKIRCGGTSSWFLYSHMRFLPNHVENDNRQTEQITNTKTEESPAQSASEESSQSSDDTEQVDNGIEVPVVIKHEPVIQNHVKRDNRATLKRTLKFKNPTKKSSVKRRLVKESNTNDSFNGTDDSVLLETLKLIRNSDLSRKKDECDSFGEYIAISLRKHDERTQSMIKQAINNILFEQEMKKYSPGQYTVVISGIDENNPLILGDEK